MTDITNILQSRANDKPSPPHLRAKAAGAPLATTECMSTRNGVSEKPQPTTNGVKTEQSAPVVEIGDAATIVVKNSIPPAKETETQQPDVNTVTESKPAVAVAPTTNGIAAHRASSESNYVTLDQVKEMFAEVNARIKALEDENLNLSKQLEAVLQIEERRKFLGTDNAKAPFPIDVQSRKSILSP
jgi:hypothetical protein